MPRQPGRARARARALPPPGDEPLEADNVKVALVGTVLWALAFVALVPFYGRLVDDGSAWIAWTCLAGFGLGVLGIEYSRRRDARSRESRRRGPRSGSPDPG